MFRLLLHRMSIAEPVERVFVWGSHVDFLIIGCNEVDSSVAGYLRLSDGVPSGI